MQNEMMSLMEKFIILSRMLMHRHHHKKGHMHSPYRGQGRILALLKLEPEMSQKKLAFLLGIRPQSMGELLAKLEQHGYITRSQSEEDRRSLTITLTEKGHEAACSEDDEQSCEQKHDTMFACLSSEEKTQLDGYLGRIIRSWQDEMTEEQKEVFEHHMHHHGHHHGHHHEGYHCHKHHGEGHRKKRCHHEREEEEANEHTCPLCKKHCNLSSPQCERGREYVRARQEQ